MIILQSWDLFLNLIHMLTQTTDLSNNPDSQYKSVESHTVYDEAVLPIYNVKVTPVKVRSEVSL